MKHLFVLTFAAVAAWCIAISQGVSSKYGAKRVHDTLLHRYYVWKESSWWRGVSADYTYPPLGWVNPTTITAIYVTDQTGGRNKSTGVGTLSGGGPGSKMATIHLKAPRGCPLNFTIEYYGHDF